MRNYHSTSGPAESEEIQSDLKTSVYVEHISLSPVNPSSSGIRCRTKLSGDYTMGTQPAHVLLCTQSVSSPDHLQYPVQGSEVHCAVYRVTRRKTCPSMFSGMQFLFACIVCFLYIFNWHRLNFQLGIGLIGCDLKSSPCGLGSNDLKASESEKTFCSLQAAPPPSPCLHHPFLYLHCRIFCFSTWSTQPEISRLPHHPGSSGVADVSVSTRHHLGQE